jgi:sulfite reductase (ferredoxin)
MKSSMLPHSRLRYRACLARNEDFYNLPRKFKISVTGCPSWCSHPEINDIALTAVEHNGQVGYSLRVGGGLSRDPHLAVRLDVFVLGEQVLPVVRAIAEIFREQQVLRESRERARMKFLFLRHGWTARTFLDEIHARIDFKLLPAFQERVPDDIYRDHTGIHPQRTPGLSYVGASVLRGRLSGDQLVAAPASPIHTVVARCAPPSRRTLSSSMSPTRRPLNWPENLTCLASTSTALPSGAAQSPAPAPSSASSPSPRPKASRAGWSMSSKTDCPAFDQQLRLHVTGCPNGCGQHWIADIGLEGKKIKHEGALVDAYYFCLGGSVGLHAAVAEPAGYRCLATDVPDSIERLLREYLSTRKQAENLRAWFTRHTNEELHSYLSGGPLDFAERDLPSGQVPHGVGD